MLELVETERDYVRDLGLVVEVSPRYQELLNAIGECINGNVLPFLRAT